MYLDYKATVWFRIPIQDEEAKQKVIDLINKGYLPAELYNELNTEHDLGPCEILYDTEEYLTPEENKAQTIELYENEKCILINKPEVLGLVEPEYKIQ